MANRVDTNVFIRAKDATKEGIAKAEKSFAKFSRKAGQAMKAIGGAAKVAGLAVSGMSGALIAAQKVAVSAAAEQAKLARTFGLTTKEMQGLSFASKAAGVEMTEVLEATRALEVSIGEAAAGNEGKAESLKLLGVSLRDTNGELVSGKDALAQITAATSGLTDKTERLGHANALGVSKLHELQQIYNVTGGSVDEFANKLESIGATVPDNLFGGAEKVQAELDTIGTQLQATSQTLLLKSVEYYGGTLSTFGATIGVIATDTSASIAEITNPVFLQLTKLKNFALSVVNPLRLHDAEQTLLIDQAQLESAQVRLTQAYSEKATNEEILAIREEIKEEEAEVAEAQALVLALTNETAEGYAENLAELTRINAETDAWNEKLAEAKKNYDDITDAASAAGAAQTPPPSGKPQGVIDEEDKQEAMKNTIGVAKNISTTVSALGKKSFEENKAIQVANAGINTYAAAALALTSSTPPFNFIAMGATIAAGLAQVAAIEATRPGGGGAGGGATTPSLPEPPPQETRINSTINVIASRGVGREDINAITRGVESELQQEFNGR